MHDATPRRNQCGRVAPFSHTGRERRAVSHRYLSVHQERYGVESERYAYENAPEGLRRCRLDFKTWHRSQPALVLYLTDVETSRSFRVSVFRRTGKCYQARTRSAIVDNPEGGVDLDQVALGSFLRAQVSYTSGGYPKLSDVEFLEGGTI